MATLPYEIVIAKNGWKIDGKKFSHGQIKKWGARVPERIKRHYDSIGTAEGVYKQVAMAYELGNRVPANRVSYCVTALDSCCAARDLVRVLTPRPVRVVLKGLRYVNPLSLVTGPIKKRISNELLPHVVNAHKSIHKLNEAPVWQNEVANEVAGLLTLLTVTVAGVIIGTEIEDALGELDLGAIASFADHFTIAGVDLHDFAHDTHSLALFVQTPAHSVLLAHEVVKHGGSILGQVGKTFVHDYFDDNLGRFLIDGAVRFW